MLCSSPTVEIAGGLKCRCRIPNAGVEPPTLGAGSRQAEGHIQPPGIRFPTPGVKSSVQCKISIEFKEDAER